MNLDRVGAGDKCPEEFNVIIEIPARGEPVKYELDKDTGAMFVDRFLETSMVYPTNYGYVPATLSEDGDPVDVLVVTPAPLIWGAVVKCRALGMLAMTDEKGPDAKVIAVPTAKICKPYAHMQTLDDVPLALRRAIGHFFEHYKDLEEGKWVKVDGWKDAEAARAEISASKARYEAQG
jgi:inorganic pyrophosphatase